MTGQKLNKKRLSDLHILACGFYLEQYPRWDTLWEGLSRSGVKQIIDMRKYKIFTDLVIDRLEGSENGNIFRRIARKVRSFYSLSRYAVAVSQTARQKKVDIIFVLPENLFLAACLGMLKLFHGAKVYFDLYTSAYSRARSHSLGMFKTAESYIMEFLSGHLADRLICLTPEYAGYYKKLYKIKDDKFSPVPDGVQNVWFEQPANISREVHRPKRVLYWGGFLAQHGLDMILDAAEELRGSNIEFILCGGGNKKSWVEEEARRRNLGNITFRGFVPNTEELINIIDSADITIGHLKNLHDTSLSGSNKMKQGMARGKPVVTVWTKQKEELYQTKDNPSPPLVQIEPSAKSLSQAIKEIINSPQKAKQIGNAARSTVKRLHSVEAITSALKESLEKALNNSRQAKGGVFRCL